MKDKLRAYLKDNGIKGYQFAERIGRDGATVSKILNGDVVFPDPETQRAIIRETNGHITANDFLGIAEHSPDGAAA